MHSNTGIPINISLFLIQHSSSCFVLLTFQLMRCRWISERASQRVRSHAEERNIHRRTLYINVCISTLGIYTARYISFSCVQIYRQVVSAAFRVFQRHHLYLGEIKTKANEVSTRTKLMAVVLRVRSMEEEDFVCFMGSKRKCQRIPLPVYLDIKWNPA